MVLRTKQIPQPELRALGGVEVLIELKDSSHWVEPDHWENFFIKIHTQDGSSSAEAGSDTPEVVWPCFMPNDSKLERPDNKGSGQSIEPKRRRVVDRSHEIWDFFQPGDQFEVALKGQKWDYPEDNYEVAIRVCNQWQPSPAVLAFA